MTISFPNRDGIYQNDSYNIELAYVVKESINGELASYSQKTYTGKKSNYTLILSSDIYCQDDNCILCDESLECVICKSNLNIQEFENKCITPVKDNYISTYINPETTVINGITSYITQSLVKKSVSIRIDPTNIINHLNFSTEKLIVNISNSIMESNIEMNNCSIDDIIFGECKISITSDQLDKIYDRLKGQIKSNQSFILSTENVIFQISSLEEQKSNLNPNISSIDLGKCEEKIKQSRNLTEDDNLIIYKIDIKSEDLSTTYVQYEINDPKTFDYIDLDICEGIFINIYTPVTLKNSTETIFQSLSDYGYNLFNLNDSFYNDICSTYTTKDGTDLTLLDRKKIIYDKNTGISMCQEGCQLINYNSSLKKANCDCKVQTENTTTKIENIKFNKKDLAQSFYKTLKNSNFLVLKCYKLVFSKKGQTNNIGSYIMSVITFIFIVLLFIFIFKGWKKINTFIRNLLKQKLNYIELEKKIKLNNFILPDKYKTKDNNKNNKTNNNKNKSKEKPKKNNNSKNKNTKNQKRDKKKGKSKGKNFPPKKLKSKAIKKNSISTNKSLSNQSQKLSQINIILNNEKAKKKNQINNKFQLNKDYSNLYKQTIKDNEFNKYNINKFNDEELNELNYEIAIELDKRTYFQYYLSLLKKKHLILFAFWPADDYNLTVIKISVLILAFSLYFTINGFFFSDETMNKINEDKGSFNILFQIPQILYSTLICALINLILKRLSLSEKQILIIKKEKDYKEAKKKSKKIKSCLKAKLIIFFVFSFY